MALTPGPGRPVNILFHNSYPGLHGSQKMALQLLTNMPQEQFETWAAAPFDTDFLASCRLPPTRRVNFQLPESFRTFRGGLLRRNPIFLFWQLLTQLLPFWWRAGRRLRKEHIDLVYASNERCLFFVGLPARFAGIPVLWHIQSGFRKGRPWVHWLASCFATRAIAVSEAVREDAQGFIRKQLWRNTRVVYNGLPDVLAAEKTEHSHTCKLIFIGALTPEKGLHILLKALGVLPKDLLSNLSLDVAGEFKEDWYREMIGQLSAGLPVRMLGYRSDVPDLLEASELLVVPSIEQETFHEKNGETHAIHWKEGFNLAALEGMRAGIPVLAASTYGLREVVADGESGLLFKPGDIADLSDKLRRLLSDPELRSQLGKQGRIRFLQYFSAEKMQSEFLQVVTEMTGSCG